MKPRVLFATREMRLVRCTSSWFVIERHDGRDATGNTIWRRVEGEALAERAGSLVRAFGESLVRREKQLRRLRRARR